MREQVKPTPTRQEILQRLKIGLAKTEPAKIGPQAGVSPIDRLYGGSLRALPESTFPRHFFPTLEDHPQQLQLASA
jgi:hypothetical protein